jgi:integrase
MAVFKRGDVYWYKFVWRGELIRRSTKQGNKRVAEQIEAAYRTALAKGEVGIREKEPVPTLRQFVSSEFLPHVRSVFKEKPKTLSYYENGTKNLLAHSALADAMIDAITSQTISGYVAKRQQNGEGKSGAPIQVATINRELQVLRRMFALASEWGKVEKAVPKVRMLPGERHRDRVLTAEEEARYLKAASELGEAIEDAYRAALEGIRAKRGTQPRRPDAYLLRDVATVLLDCALRPEECFRLTWTDIRDGGIEIAHGKTENARRRVALTQRVTARLEMRKGQSDSPWVFPAPTRSGHAEPSSVKKQHDKACKNAKVTPFELYTLRHTCLTRWAPHMDPWTLAHLAGHRDMAITKRYIHPQDQQVREAMERARAAQGRHNSGHSGESAEI